MPTCKAAANRGLFKGDAGRVRYVAIMRKLEDRADALRAMPVTEARKEIVMSHDLFCDRWASLETDHEAGAVGSLGVERGQLGQDRHAHGGAGQRQRQACR